MNFDEYMAMFYRWLDEQRKEMQDFRSEMREFREENNRGHREYESLFAKLVENNGLIINLISKIDDKLDDQDHRLTAGGL
jgi:hypothetical protein